MVTESRDSALACLVAVAQHHRLSTSAERLVHDHALPDTPLSANQIASIATKTGLKASVRVTDMKGLESLERLYPLLACLKNGNYVIVVGRDETEDGDPVVVVFDPTEAEQNILPVPANSFEEAWGGTVVLLKRQYALMDEKQPFGLRWFIPEILKEKRAFRDIIIAAMTLHLTGLVTPIFVQLVIDKVLSHQSYATLYVLTAGVVFALFFDAGFGYIRQHLLLLASNKIDIRLVTRTFSHLLALPISYFENTDTGVTVRHMQQVETIREFLTGKLFLTGLDATVLLIYLPILFFYSPFLAILVLAFTAAIALVVISLIAPFKKRLEELYSTEAERQAMLVETIGGMRTVKSLAIEPLQRRTWDSRASAAVRAHFKVGRISMSASTLTQLLEKLMMVTIIAVGATLVFDSAITIGALIAFNMLSSRVVGPLVQIVSLVHEYQETALSVRMLGKVMNHPVEREGQGAGIRPQFEGGIEFEDVSFQYTVGRAKALDEVSLSIAPGAVIGIVGRSGSGKSTLTRLIQGLYPVQEGVVRLDGYDIREIDLVHLRRNIGVVMQESFLFRGTVRENIAQTKPDASIDEVVEVARIAGANEFIEKLPQGFDTPLDENASNLSGGQKQRLAIARALLSQPRYLIFDEATSALDPESEAIFMDNLAKLAEGRTVIIVSHRLSTLTESDSIVVMDEGKIIDNGKHEDLLKRCEIYEHLWRKQNRHL